MKDEDGAAFIITLPSVLRPMGSWWPNGAVFPPLPVSVDWSYPSPKCRLSSTLGVRPVRVQRHNPFSIATLRQTIARVLLRQLSSCPFCGAPFLGNSNNVVAEVKESRRFPSSCHCFRAPSPSRVRCAEPEKRRALDRCGPL